MEKQHIMRWLEVKLLKAREWRECARAEFEANISGTGIPQPDGALAIHKSAREYERAIRAAQKALQDQVHFLVWGTAPDDLPSEPGAEQQGS